MEVGNITTVLLVLLVRGLACMNINFKTCGNDPQQIKSIDITPCDQQPCVFQHGINVTVTVDFIARKSSTFTVIKGSPIKTGDPDTAEKLLKVALNTKQNKAMYQKRSEKSFNESHGQFCRGRYYSTQAEGSQTLNAEIYGIVAGIPVKFNMPNPNGCNQSGIICPIKPSTEYVYTSEFFVLKSYPNIRLAVQWDLKSDSGKYLFCFTFPMEIVS